MPTMNFPTCEAGGGAIVDLLVSPGDSIQVDTPVLQLQHDQSQFAANSTVDGKVTNWLVRVGDEIICGQPILEYE